MRSAGSGQHTVPGCVPFPPTTHAAFSVGTQDSRGTQRHATPAKPTGPRLPPSHQRGLYAVGAVLPRSSRRGHSGRPCSTHTHTHTHMCIFTHAHTYKCTMHSCTHTLTHSHTCAKCRHVRAHMHTRASTHINMHVHTHRHTHRHIHTHSSPDQTGAVRADPSQ